MKHSFDAAYRDYSQHIPLDIRRAPSQLEMYAFHRFLAPSRVSTTLWNLPDDRDQSFGDEPGALQRDAGGGAESPLLVTRLLRACRCQAACVRRVRLPVAPARGRARMASRPAALDGSIRPDAWEGRP